MAFGAAWITAVALKDIAAEVGGVRSIPALASALAWLGSGVGGILMGRIADKIGTRWTVIFGSLMIGVGLTISTLGPRWPLWIGHGLCLGLIVLGRFTAPLYIYVRMWFDRRPGSPFALLSRSTYLAGSLWPLVSRAIEGFGWRQTMLWYAIVEIVTVPLAAIYSCTTRIEPPAAATTGDGKSARVGWPPNLVFVMWGRGAVAFRRCRRPPVAFCSDSSVAPLARLPSVLLGTAFFSRQIWGAT